MSGSVAACIQALSLRGVNNARSVIKKATEEPGNVRKVFASVTRTGSSPVLPIDLPGELLMNLFSLKLSTAHNDQSNRTVTPFAVDTSAIP